MTPIRADSVSGDESLTTRLARLRLPVGAALGMFVALYAATTIRLLRVTEGHFTYALDDAYIHMAIAKNLALHGVWGLQQDSFAAASSSPLWTALLAAVFALGGVHEAVPLVLNTAFAVIGIVALGVILERERIFGLPMFGVIAAVVLFAPTVPMIWIGMEHSLHILLTLIVASLCGGLVRRYSAVRLTALCAAAALMVATRYEGLFVVAGCVVVLVARKRRGGAAALLAAGALPVACVGLWNMSHGWFFLPASIMMKQTVLPDSVGGTLWSSLLANIVHADAPAAFLALRAVAVALLAQHRYQFGSSNDQPLLVIFVTAAVLHLCLAKFGWLYRYESYLMALGVLAIGLAGLKGVHADVVLVGILFAVLAANGRTLVSHLVTANTAGHIFRQQHQMAAFIGRYYNAEAVALNDIGAVSYFTNARVHDLEGLGSLEAAAQRRRGRVDADHINAWLERDGVGVAIVYNHWFTEQQAFQHTWQRVGEWRTDPSPAADSTVAFYAQNGEAATLLRAHLREFEGRLPSGVAQTLEPDGAEDSAHWDIHGPVER